MALSHRFVIQDYEERRLESSKWISTTIIGVYQELAKIEGFKLLQAYIQGQNEEGTYTILLQLTTSGYGQKTTITDHRPNPGTVRKRYSKTCVKRTFIIRPQIGFQDQLSLIAGQKYFRMLQGENSAILSTSIKPIYVTKILICFVYF